LPRRPRLLKYDSEPVDIVHQGKSVEVGKGANEAYSER
jgi:hypothetical protein